MKKLTVLLLAAAFLAVGCNNNNPKKTEEGGGGLFGGNNGGNNGPKKGGNGWATQDRDKFMNDCTTGLGEAVGNPKQVCSCVLENLEKKYASLAEADRVGGKAEGERAVRECMQGTGGDINGGDVPVRNDGGGDYTGGDQPAGGGWTYQQKQTFMNQCVPSAQQAQGLTLQQATSYCECMTNKVAAKFTYPEANRLTAAEFQKQEWQQAMMDCRPNANY